MKIRIFTLILAVATLPLSLSAQSFEEKLTTASNVRMTINNLGMIGNAFRGSYNLLNYPSAEFPANSNVEHLFQGGIWVGADVPGKGVVVSTGAVDDPSGYSTGKAGYEWTTEVGSQLNERSSLLDNPRYDPAAVSHQDFVSTFSDQNVTVPGTSIQIQGLENGPLGAQVNFESYNWNFAFADFFTILNFTITNNSNDVWQNVYVGYWLDPVIRNVAVTAAGSGGSAFYNKGGSGYLEDDHLAYEFDAAGDIGRTESYMGFKYLGSEKNGVFLHPDVDTSFKVHYNSWSFRDFGSALGTPNNDNERYERLADGLQNNEDWPQLQQTLKAPSNRSILLSAGPYVTLMPGESINVAFACVFARKVDTGEPPTADSDAQRANLEENLTWAQSAYNGEDANFNGQLDPGEDADGNGRITRYILPSPPAIPDTRFEADDNQITIYWSDNAETSVDPISKRRDFEGYRVYMTEPGWDVQGENDIGAALRLVARWDSSGNRVGLDNGFTGVRLEEPVTFEDDPVEYHYRYVIDEIPDGWQHGVALTAFDQGEPEANLESLETSRLANLKRVFTGRPPNNNFANGDPFVYPNPYYGSASWEGASESEEDRRIMFANIPERAEIRIYTVAGDLIDVLEHDATEYDGSNVRWTETYSDAEETRFSGGEHAWDLLSQDNQIIARGIYVFVVKDKNSGDKRQGKFVVIK